MRVLLTIEYDGTDFFGWQIQPDKRTVQGELTAAISSLLGQKVVLHGSGRTDAGVHALGQKAHFDWDNPSDSFPLDKLPLAINTRLPADVCVKEAVKVDDAFEAQYSAKKKTYRYSFYLSRVNRPLLDRFATRVPYGEEKFDVERAKSGLRYLIGEHDFIAFSSTGRPVKSSVRTIYNATIERADNGVWSITVTGNGFLYNMVRIIAGTIVEIGLGLRPADAVCDALATGGRCFCGKTFPANGLTLINVEYI